MLSASLVLAIAGPASAAALVPCGARALAPTTAAVRSSLASPATAPLASRAASSGPASSCVGSRGIGGGSSVRQDLDDIEARLRDPKVNVRREAVLDLSKRRGEEALELALRALRDEYPAVADTAQLVLPEMLEPETLQFVLGKRGLDGRDEWLSLRIAEALGRLSFPIESSVFERVVYSKEDALRGAVFHAAERLARAGRLVDREQPSKKFVQRVKKALKSDPPHLAASALMTLAALTPSEAATLAREQLASRVPELRSAALQLLVRDVADLDDETERALVSALDDEALGVRITAVEALATHPTRAHAESLVERLALEPNLRLRWTIVHQLQRLTGRKDRLNADAWRSWLASVDENADFATPQEATAIDAGEVTVSFAGLQILSERVCFLVDFSGSLWQQGQRDNLQTRKQAADIELRKALEALPENARFNVIPYTDTPFPWEKKLVEAEPKRVRKALDWFERQKQVGKGNFWDALELALEDPEVDTIVVLSDGAPTGGHRWSVDLMNELWRERNRFRRVVLDAVLVDCKSYLTSKWYTLCEDGGGRVVEVEL